MKKIFTLSPVTFLAFICMLASCSTQYPQFTRSHHYKNRDTQYAAKAVKNNHDKTAPLYKIEQNKIVLASNDRNIPGAIREDVQPYSVPATAPVSTRKNAARVHPAKAVHKKSEFITSIPFNNRQTSAKIATHASHGDRLLCAIIAIFIACLGVLLYEDELTVHFWIALILEILFWLPGFIYAMIIIFGD